MSITLTTNDNYLTIRTKDGTDIKKIYLKTKDANGTEIQKQVYQKWKDGDCHANTQDVTVDVKIFNEKVCYGGYKNSYCDYGMSLKMTRAWIGNDSLVEKQSSKATLTAQCIVDGKTILTGTVSRDTTADVSNVIVYDNSAVRYTVRSGVDTSYDSKEYPCSCLVMWRNASGKNVSSSFAGTTPKSTITHDGTDEITLVVAEEQHKNFYCYNIYKGRVKDE